MRVHVDNTSSAAGFFLFTRLIADRAPVESGNFPLSILAPATAQSPAQSTPHKPSSTLPSPDPRDTPRARRSAESAPPPASAPLPRAARPTRNPHPPAEGSAQAVDAAPAKAGHPQLHRFRCGAAWRRRRWDRRTVRARVRRCPDRTARAGNGSPMCSWQCSVQDR